ncbi:F-box associated domain containing protein, partial [Tanacetum coccineum]
FVVQYLNLMAMEDFAEDVMWDILSRLNYKTVSCCKCVCKRWRDLVLDPYFINNLLWSNKKNQSLMIHDTTFDKRGRLKWIEIQDTVVEVEKEQLVDVVTIYDVDLSRPGVLSRFPDLIDFQVFIGPSVNGLICVWDAFGNTYIVNPIARQYLTLPDNQSSIIGYGFGSLDDASYKVIRIFQRYLTPAYEDKNKITQIDVFTLGTDSWRVLQPNDHFSNIHGYMGDGLFFNGRVHWINAGGHQLFAFELDNENFKLFPSPSFEGEENEQKYRGILGVVKGCLSQGCYYSCEIFTVWVMKEHGIKDSWYKAFTIKETRIARKLRCPLCLLDGLKGGILIARAGDKLVAYCLQTNTLRTINLTSLPATSNRRNCTVDIQSAITYHPTFLNLQNFASPNTPVQTF